MLYIFALVLFCIFIHNKTDICVCLCVCQSILILVKQALEQDWTQLSGHRCHNQ